MKIENLEIGEKFLYEDEYGYKGYAVAIEGSRALVMMEGGYIVIKKSGKSLRAIGADEHVPTEIQRFFIGVEIIIKSVEGVNEKYKLPKSSR